MKITIPIDIDDAKVVNALISAVEGGSTYWCRDITVGRQGILNSGDEVADLFYLTPLRGGWWRVTEQDPSGADVRPVDLNTITAAIKVIAEKYPHHLRDLLGDTGDATTGDVLLQCAVFGDLVYG